MTDSLPDFLRRHFLHFNAGALLDAANAYAKLINDGGKMFLSMAGAMSTGEIGISLAEMIRQNKVHAISCTGANLEEDVFLLVGHSSYGRIPRYRDLTPKDEQKLLGQKDYRVTDTLLPQGAMLKVEKVASELWRKLDKNGERAFPHEILYEVLRSGALRKSYEMDPKDSWMMAAMEKNLPLFVPGWEDSTLGNVFASEVYSGDVENPNLVKNGIEYMVELAHWYEKTVDKKPSIGFFQIGGGIAGDFPICVVPMFHEDLKKKNVPVWAYFCQISDSTTSYGSYSGAMPNEKITWDKIAPDTPQFVIESDASIVWPLIAGYVLNTTKVDERRIETLTPKLFPQIWSLAGSQNRGG